MKPKLRARPHVTPTKEAVMDPVRVAMVEDQTILRDLLAAALITARPHFTVVYSGDNADAAAQLKPTPDLVLLDLNLHGQAPSTHAVATLVDGGAAVLVLSALAELATVKDMVRIGVSGFVSKEDSQDVLLDAIDTVLTGESWTNRELAAALSGFQDQAQPPLTPTEEQVLTLVARGLTQPAVANRLNMSPNTVKTHLLRMREKFRDAGRPAGSAAQLTVEAVRRGLIDGSPHTQPLDPAP